MNEEDVFAKIYDSTDDYKWMQLYKKGFLFR